MNDASGQELPRPEVKPEPQPQKVLDIKPRVAPQPEIKAPRTATFGSVEVKEDLNSDLLTDHEKKLYRGGMAMLEDVVAAADNNVSRMVLTNPDMVSGIVGLQPLVSMRTGEAVLLYQGYRRAGIDFNQDYSFLEFGKERDYMKIFVNDKAAENALRTYQKELGISLPDRALQKEEILSYTTQLLNNPDARQANLAHGLLSGFPLEECQYWVNEGQATVTPIPTLKKVENLDNRFLQETPIPGSDKVMRIDPISLLDPADYEMSSSRNHFLPDTRAFVAQGAMRRIVEGFGLRWATPLPARESTVWHAQKVLQVDREVGLLNFVNKQRSTFKVDNNINAIGTQRELLHKAPTKLGKLSGVAGLAIGIFSLFGSLVKGATEPPHQKYKEERLNRKY